MSIRVWVAFTCTYRVMQGKMGKKTKNQPRFNQLLFQPFFHFRRKVMKQKNFHWKKGGRVKTPKPTLRSEAAVSSARLKASDALNAELVAGSICSRHDFVLNVPPAIDSRHFNASTYACLVPNTIFFWVPPICLKKPKKRWQLCSLKPNFLHPFAAVAYIIIVFSHQIFP